MGQFLPHNPVGWIIRCVPRNYGSTLLALRAVRNTSVIMIQSIWQVMFTGTHHLIMCEAWQLNVSSLGYLASLFQLQLLQNAEWDGKMALNRVRNDLKEVVVACVKYQSQSHITTEDQSVSPSWFRGPSGSPDRILISVGHLLFYRCRAPPLTRGRVCHLH
jgi:hypothetical protein